MLKQRWAIRLLAILDIQLQIVSHHSDGTNLILVGNHISFLDIIVLMAAEPRVVFLAKSEVAGWPIVGAGARRMQTLFVKRESVSSRAASKLAIYEKIQSAGNNLYIAGFPSGTTSLVENRPWKKGLFEIAMKTGTELQSFRINYSPLRACAYIDNDNLFGCLMNLFSTPNKIASLEWGPSQNITNLSEQMAAIQNWTQLEIRG